MRSPCAYALTLPLVRFALSLTLLLAAAISPISALDECTVKAQVEVGPSPDPGCLNDPFDLTLTADFTQRPAINKECRITGEEWLWTVEKVLYSDCSSSPADKTAEKKPFIDIKKPKKQTTPVKVKSGAFDKAGKWTVTFKVVGTVHTSNCGDCTASDTVSPDFHVVDFEIQINNTAAQDDDYVQVHDPVCGQRFTTACQARVLGCPPSAVAVTLTNPDGRIAFPTSTTASLSLPSGGTWVAFSISGESKSKAVDDAKIELHMGGTSGKVCKKEDATVFYFDGKLTLTNDGAYILHPSGSAGILTFDPNYPTEVAIKMSAEAALKPDSANCSAPEIAPWRIGIVQNLVGSYRNRGIYRVDHVDFMPAAASRTKTSVAKRIYIDRAKSPPAQDSIAADDPFYDRSTIQLPTNCGGGASTADDSPSSKNIPMEITRPAMDSSGAVVGTAFYLLEEYEIERNWTTWCVAWDSSTAGIQVVPLRQANWDVDADSGENTKADVGSDRKAKDCPLTGPTYANDLPAATATSDHGSSTFRKP